jgi:8-oxo-dGTP pyrophosphatase MutT (NUDIX family)
MEEFSLAAKSFIVDKHQQPLVIRRRSDDVHSPGVWDLPGGRLRAGEDPFEGLKRETKEEAGMEIEVLNPLSIHHFTRDDGQKIIMMIFLCRPLTTNVKLSGEHTDFDWIDITRPTEKLDKNFHDNIQIYNKHFRNASP